VSHEVGCARNEMLMMGGSHILPPGSTIDHELTSPLNNVLNTG